MDVLTSQKIIGNLYFGWLITPTEKFPNKKI